jgi:sigma-B regulation protein RsbU (phosphoserine phosphatase)
MRILIAEDDAVSRHVLQATLSKWRYEVVVTTDGTQALEILRREDRPSLAILDWMMPGLDGVQVCQEVRATPTGHALYLILLTAKSQKDDIVAGLEAGADDYVRKPFDHAELRARIQVGIRTLALQQALADRVRELEVALAQIEVLQGILPICSYCKKVRDDQNYWQQVDAYISAHSGTRFSHSICPCCYADVVAPALERLHVTTRG